MIQVTSKTQVILPSLSAAHIFSSKYTRGKRLAGRAANIAKLSELARKP
jgi:hypothetical protein